MQERFFKKLPIEVSGYWLLGIGIFQYKISRLVNSRNIHDDSANPHGSAC